MTTTKTARQNPRLSGAPDKPVVYFSDEASAVMRPVPGPAQRLRPPLETLMWQAPPALDDGDDDLR
ncbi:hypothetical protein ACFVGY_33045 [Streptomyces sp. NPDC127106]|uniref:hypothetical protein n=1 Tax=Streptomyces sp. NPDC127106 TaxID=3345360 RepID=UPI003643C067